MSRRQHLNTFVPFKININLQFVLANTEEKCQISTLFCCCCCCCCQLKATELFTEFHRFRKPFNKLLRARFCYSPSPKQLLTIPPRLPLPFKVVSLSIQYKLNQPWRNMLQEPFRENSEHQTTVLHHHRRPITMFQS